MNLTQNTFLPAYKNRPPVRPFSLTFLTEDLENAFHRFYTSTSLGFVRIILLLAVFLIMIFAVLDYVILNELLAHMMGVRIVISIFIVGCIGCTFTTKGADNLQLLMSLVVIVASLGIIYMIYESNDVGGHRYYAGLLLAIMYAHGLMRLRFMYASITTWFVILVYLAASHLIMQPNHTVVLNNAFFLVSANIMGMFTSYWIEFYMRNSFWQSKQLEKKTDELESEYKRKSNELMVSRQLQLDMLPDSSPYHPDYEFCFCMSTASEIGGDFYDYFMDEQQNLTFAIGDATGHGARAGAMVTAIKILFLEHAGKFGLTDFLNNANETIRRIGFNKLYMSFAIFRLQDDLLTIAGAGIPAGLLYRAESGTLEQIELKGLPLGGPANYPYREQTFRLYPGDTLMLMTDGFPELYNADRIMYGYENTCRLFVQHASLSPLDILSQFENAITLWQNGSPQNDDITFILLQKKNK